MGRYKYSVTTTELNWIISSLNRTIADIKAEMEASPDGSPICAVGEVVLDGREALVTKLADIIKSGTRSIGVY